MSPPAARAAFLAASMAVLAALLPGGRLAAQDAGYPPISPEEIEAGNFKPLEKRSVTGKYLELINSDLRLAEVKARFQVNLASAGRTLLELKPQKDNVTLRGFFLRPEDAPKPPGPVREGETLPVFRVEKVEPAPGDGPIYEAKLKAVLSRASTAGELIELAETIAARLHRYGDPALAPLARQAFNEAFLKTDASLPEGDADGRLQVIRHIHEELKDEEFTVRLLRVQARRYRDHPGTIAFLRELRCFQIEGEWLPYGEFKKKLGFVNCNGKWVKPARKELLVVLDQVRKENSTNTILRIRTDREYSLLARTGKVEKGMTREELAEALGLPDRVERQKAGEIEIDQWNYGDRRVYLLNGQVLAVLGS